MKKIFKACLLAAILLVGINVNAQDCPVTFGVKAGANLSNFGGDVNDTDAKFGFQAGVTVEYALSEGFFLQSGLEFTTKGAKSNMMVVQDGISTKVKSTFNPMYLQLPVHAAYKVNVAENIKIVFNAGPYIAYGVGGKIKAETKVDNVKVSADENIFSKDNFKRFDVGLGGGVGAEFGKIGVNLGYDFGLANINQNNGGKVRNQNAYLTLGYKF